MDALMVVLSASIQDSWLAGWKEKGVVDEKDNCAAADSAVLTATILSAAEMVELKAVVRVV